MLLTGRMPRQDTADEPAFRSRGANGGRAGAEESAPPEEPAAAWAPPDPTARATGATLTPSTPLSPVAPPRHDPGPAAPRRSGGFGQYMKWIAYGLIALVVAGAMGMSQFTETGGGEDSAGEAGRFGMSDESYSYYHDDYFDGNRYSSKYQEDGLLESEKGWRYDGPYDYEGYGSAGMASRKEGKGTDPVLSPVDRSPGVFEQHGLSSDPTAGEPVGDPWAAYLDPTYSPYAGYANPYANQIRMGFGQGSGRGAYLEYP